MEKITFEDDEIFSLIKFTDYADDLLKGDLFMNNSNTFVQEGKEGSVGRGDREEVANILIKPNIQVYKNGEFFLDAQADKLIEQKNENLYTPIYSMFAVTGKDLIIESEDEEKVVAKINLKNLDVDKFLQEFSYTEAVLTIPSLFIEAMEKTFEEKRYNWERGLVNYVNFNSNIENEYIDSSRNNELFFRKDSLFAHQREYRIVLLNKDIQDVQPVNIGDISDFSVKYPAKQIVEGIRIEFLK